MSLCSPDEKQGTRLIKYASLTAYPESLLAQATRQLPPLPELAAW